jgi:hypothetical protein
MSSRNNWCKHYNGGVNKVCRAGVNYKQAFPRLEFDQFPCLNRDSSIPCEFVIFRTPEEIEAEHLERAESLKFYAQASRLIAALSGHAGTIDCPKCNGSLSWGRASNRHVHGACETEGCLAWMQ